MRYADLRDFLARLEAAGELKRIATEVDPQLEITEICDRVLKAGGPALLFEKPKGHSMPVLANLFGTPRRVALGMGREALEALREGWRLEDPVEADGLWRLFAYRTPPLEPADVIEAAARTRETCLHQVAMLLRERGGE